MFADTLGNMFALAEFCCDRSDRHKIRQRPAIAPDPRFGCLLSAADWAALPQAVRTRFGRKARGTATISYIGTVDACTMSRTGRFLAQLARLIPAPDEIFIVADGCTDGTADLVRVACPQARLIEHATGAGSVASRDEMARASACDILLSLDDDSYPIELDAIVAVVREIGQRVGLATPNIDALLGLTRLMARVRGLYPEQSDA